MLFSMKERQHYVKGYQVYCLWVTNAMKHELEILKQRETLEGKLTVLPGKQVKFVCIIYINFAIIYI